MVTWHLQASTSSQRRLATSPSWFPSRASFARLFLRHLFQSASVPINLVGQSIYRTPVSCKCWVRRLPGSPVAALLRFQLFDKLSVVGHHLWNLSFQLVGCFISLGSWPTSFPWILQIAFAWNVDWLDLKLFELLVHRGQHRFKRWVSASLFGIWSLHDFGCDCFWWHLSLRRTVLSNLVHWF